MSKQPKVSIIVPIYNVEKYLDRCIQSLINQTLKEIEIVLVDDGSPDNCPQMCDEYAKKDSRIKVIHKKNAGLGYARNSGMEIMTGEYVAFVDSDDFVDVKMYEVLYESAKQNDCDAVFCGFRTETSKGIWVNSDEVHQNELWEKEEVQHFMLNMIASGPRIKKERLYQMSVWHSIYKNKIIKENEILFPSEREVVSEDIPFQIDFLLKADKVAYIKNVFYSYCLNGTSLTATFKFEKFDRFKRLRICLLDKCNSLDFRNRVNRLFIGYSRSLCFQYCSINNSKSIHLKKVLEDNIWKTIDNEFSVSYLPLYSRVIYMAILSRNYKLVFFLLKIMLGVKNFKKKATYDKIKG